MNTKTLKIDCISDTHTKHKKILLPGGDILIHSGDCSSHGDKDEVIAFLNWLQVQDYSYIVLIAGNHDFIFETAPELMQKECESRNIILLNDSGIEIEGLKFWGSPVQPWFYDWAFNRARTEREVTSKHGWIKKHWDMIPADTDVLITHGPPYGIRDEVPRRGGSIENVGCEELAKKILETNTMLHVFGHIHEGAGHSFIDGRLYVNASSLDGQYMFEGPGYIRVSTNGVDFLIENES